MSSDIFPCMDIFFVSDLVLDIGGYFVYKEIMENKKSKKPLINFNEFWPDMKNEARRQGLRKIEWMQKSGVPYQRYSEFDKQIRDVSAQYFIKLMGGLNLKQDKVEQVLGRKMTDDQKRALKFQALVEVNRDWIEVLLSDPEMSKMCKKLVLVK